MPSQSSEVATSPSISTLANQSTPIVFPFSGLMDQNASEAHTSFSLAARQVIAKQCERGNSKSGFFAAQHQQKESRNNPILSPPAINNWHAMSTAATTIISNIHPRLSAKHRGELLPHMLPMDVPLHHHYQADVVMDDEVQNSYMDIPPVCEVHIPSQQRPKHRADIDDDCDYDDDDDDDADTTTSTQNLSRNDHQHYNAIDYKGMYFASQRQNYRLREQVQDVQEDNRKLKRQLIEMQKQLYAYSRNKRTAASSSMHQHANRHPNHEAEEVAPWSIPMSSNKLPRHHYQQQHRVLMVRQLQPSNSTVSENTIISSIRPANATASMESAVTTTAPAPTSESLPSIAGITTSSPSNGVSMSVSSEEGNTIHSGE